jgi:hypothetical protein
MRIAATCSCGVRLGGELDPSSRELIHRFSFPAGATLSGAPTTEVDSRIATFPPDSKDWVLACPLCGATIPIDPERGSNA